MADYKIPQINTNFQPLQSPFGDPFKIASQISRGNTALARAMRGGRSGTPQMQQAWTGQFDANGNPVFTMVPKGMTQKERAAFMGAQQADQAFRVLQGDPVISEKLSKLNTVPVSEQANILEDIRRNDIDRLTKTSGIPSSELFKSILKPYEAEVTARQEAIESSDGFTAVGDALKIGARRFVSALSAAVQGGGAERYKAATEDHKRYREKVLEENAFLRDRAMGGDSGNLLGKMGEAIGEMLPAAGASIAGSLAGAAIGASVAGPPGALIGGVIGGALPEASYEPFAFSERIVNDPNLTEAQKLQAIDQGIVQAAGSGAIIGGAIPMGVSRVGGKLLGAIVDAGIPGVSRAAQVASSPVANAVGRYAQRVGTTGTELALMNTAGIASQNINVARTTGQDVPVLEGVGEGLAQAALAAPFFGLMPRGQARPEPTPRATPEVTNSTPNPTPSSPSPTIPRESTTYGVPVEFAQTFRSNIKAAIQDGTPIDPQGVQREFLAAGYTPEQFMSWLDSDARVIPSARLGKRVIDRIKSDLLQPTIAPEWDNFTTQVRRLKKGESEDAKILVNSMLDLGTSIDDLQKYLIDSARKKADLQKDASANINNPLTKVQRGLIAEALEDIRIAREEASKMSSESPTIRSDETSPRIIPEGANDAPTIANADAASSTAPASPVVGPDVAGREAPITSADPNVDSGMATDPSGPVATPASTGTSEPSASYRATEGGRISGVEEQSVRTDQTVDVPTQNEGYVAGRGADAGPSVIPTTSADAATGSRTGSAASATDGSSGNISNAAGISRNVIREDSPSVIVKPTHLGSEADNKNWGVYDSRTNELIQSGLTKQQAIKRGSEIATEKRNREIISPAALEESGMTPEVAEFQKSFTIPGETRIPDVSAADNFSLRYMRDSMNYETDRLAPIIGKDATKRSLTGNEIIEARTRAVDIMVKEALGEKLNAKELATVRYLHDELGFQKLKLPTDVMQQFSSAKAEGLDVNTRQIAETVMDPDTSVKKILDRIWCRV